MYTQHVITKIVSALLSLSAILATEHMQPAVDQAIHRGLTPSKLRELASLINCLASDMEVSYERKVSSKSW